MNYQELTKLFYQHESSAPERYLTAYITFSSFGPENTTEYPWEARTYVVSSNNKAFQPNKGGYSIFGSCLDGTDDCVRLDHLMKEEHGGKNGWVVEECCIIGYLLLSDCCSNEENRAPELYYSIEAVREQMLCQMAEVGERDPDQLKAAYAAGKCDVMTEDYYANKKSASLTTEHDTWAWEIKPAYIYSLTHIEFGCECR